MITWTWVSNTMTYHSKHNARSVDIREETKDLIGDIFGYPTLAIRVAIEQVRDGKRYPVKFRPDEIDP